MGEMYRSIVRLLVVYLLIVTVIPACCQSQHRPTTPPPKQLQRNKPMLTVEQAEKARVPLAAAATILAVKGKKVGSVGTGVVIRYRKGEHIIVLTAAHVYQHLVEKNLLLFQQDVIVRLPASKKAILMRLMAIDTGGDIAALRSIGPVSHDGPEVKLAQQVPQQGHLLYTVGNPGQYEHVLEIGMMTDVAKSKTGHVRYSHDINTWFGNSGSGTFNRDGELVGIATHIQPSLYRAPYCFQARGLSLGLSSILKFLQENNIPYDIATKQTK